MRPVPPRGGGWVSVRTKDLHNDRLPTGRTRYRVVVLTSWDRRLSDFDPWNS